jgi:hypothetical protein
MQYTRYFLLSAALPLLCFFLLGVYIQPLSGDLTRMGKLPERDFGWNAAQPVIHPITLPHGVPPLVAVLGDSFSERNLWQSVAMKETAAPILSFHWRSVGDHNCMSQWLASVKAAYPSLRVVVVQSVERMFVKRWSAAARACQLGKLELMPGEVLGLPAQRPVAVEWGLPDAAYAWRAAFSSLRHFDRNTRSSATYIAPLTRGDLFSNKRSDLMLVYKDDLEKAEWRAAEMSAAGQHAKAMQQAARALGMELVTMVVPDKSTVYAPYLKEPLFKTSAPDLWRHLDAVQVAQIDPRPALSDAVPRTKDLYLPNDTHVGAAGYVLMGKAVANWLKQARSQLIDAKISGPGGA